MTAEPRELAMGEAQWRLIRSHLQVVNTIVVVDTITDAELEAFIDANQRADVLGPLMDPSAWVAGRENLNAITEAAKALLAHRRAIRKAAGL